MRRSALNEFRKVLYNLKRKYHGSIVINRRVDSTLNVETGRRAVETESWAVDQAIILPNEIKREFAYDLAFIASAKNFTYGMQFETGIRRVIVDLRDLPSGWRPDYNDYVVYRQVRYDIKEIQEFEFDSGIIYTLKALEGQVSNNNIPVHWRSTLHLNDEVEYDQ